jgi:hypothetical protein
MTKTTLSILSSILLSTALTAPAIAGAQTRYPFLDRFLSAHAQHPAKDNQGKRLAGAHKARSGPLDAELTTYDAPDATGTSGAGINDAGSVAGEYGGADGHTHAFLRAGDGSFTLINVDGNPTSAFWLNGKGEVIGDYLEGGIVSAYLRKPNGRILKIEIPDSQHADGLDINDKGVATGDYADSNGLWHGFIRARDGSLTIFDEPDAGVGPDLGTFAGATDIHGDTIGPYVDENGILHGYIRHVNGAFDPLDVAGALDTIPFNENAKGWVVGLYDHADEVTHGFIRKPDGKIIAVDAPDAGTGPGQGTVVQTINKHGVATGNYIDANNVSHGFVFRVKGRTITEFDAPGAGPGGTWPIGINNAEEISGSMFDESDSEHGLIGTVGQ